MSSTITAIAVLALLAVWHGHNRRHPGWRASADGRNNIYCGYFLVMIAAYWLVNAPTATAWEWALGNLWALSAMVAFVAGFDGLNRATATHAQRAQVLESLDPSAAGLPRQN